MHLKKTLIITAALLASIGCSSNDKKATEQPAETVPADKEIKMDDVESQLKSDEERADSLKKALGIE